MWRRFSGSRQEAHCRKNDPAEMVRSLHNVPPFVRNFGPTRACCQYSKRSSLNIGGGAGTRTPVQETAHISFYERSLRSSISHLRLPQAGYIGASSISCPDRLPERGSVGESALVTPVSGHADLDRADGLLN